MRKLMIFLFLTVFSVSLSFGQADIGQETSQTFSLSGDTTISFEADISKASGFFEFMLLVDTLGTVTFNPDAVDIKFAGREKFGSTWETTVNDTNIIATDTTLVAGLMNWDITGSTTLEEFERVMLILDFDAGDTASVIIRLKFSRN